MSEYGSVHRQAMKRSMSRPAGEWKPTNRVEYPPLGSWFQFGLVIVIGLLLTAVVVAQVVIYYAKH